MNSLIIRIKNEEGNLTIIAFVLLVVLTLIGVFATKTAQIDLQTAYNEIPYKQNFYVAEGGANKEMALLGAQDLSHVGQVDHLDDLLGKSYKYTVNYLGAYLPPKGYSALLFSSYHYNVEAKAGGTAASGEVRVAIRGFIPVLKP